MPLRNRYAGLQIDDDDNECERTPINSLNRDQDARPKDDVDLTCSSNSSKSSDNSSSLDCLGEVGKQKHW